MADPNEYTRMSGEVVAQLRDANFRVRIDNSPLEVIARAAGRMRRGRGIRILPGDRVDVDVSTYDPRRGRIVWRHR